MNNVKFTTISSGRMMILYHKCWCSLLLSPRVLHTNWASVNVAKINCTVIQTHHVHVHASVTMSNLNSIEIVHSFNYWVLRCQWSLVENCFVHNDIHRWKLDSPVYRVEVWDGIILKRYGKFSKNLCMSVPRSVTSG